MCQIPILRGSLGIVKILFILFSAVPQYIVLSSLFFCRFVGGGGARASRGQLPRNFFLISIGPFKSLSFARGSPTINFEVLSKVTLPSTSKTRNNHSFLMSFKYPIKKIPLNDKIKEGIYIIFISKIEILIEYRIL